MSCQVAITIRRIRKTVLRVTIRPSRGEGLASLCSPAGNFAGWSCRTSIRLAEVLVMGDDGLDPGARLAGRLRPLAENQVLVECLERVTSADVGVVQDAIAVPTPKERPAVDVVLHVLPDRPRLAGTGFCIPRCGDAP